MTAARAPGRHPGPMIATRVVLLGASNLTMGLPAVLATVRDVLGAEPLEIFVAAGHGRSYGRWSRVFVRGLPGIVGSGLWAAAAGTAGRHAYALVTDIGNDLAYGATPDQLVGWVTTCVERLARMDARTALTLLPARSLARLGPWRYHVLKAVVFPGRRLGFRLLQARVAEVNERLEVLALRHGCAVVEPPADWYGRDAIHIRRDRHAVAWPRVLSHWEPAAATALGGPPPGRLHCPGLRPEVWSLCGVRLGRRQPSGRLPDATPVSLF
ncbi:MAG: SGNH/GDSL hydrolase family protein [Candidatus Rokuibacteriota bacterium]